METKEPETEQETEQVITGKRKAEYQIGREPGGKKKSITLFLQAHGAIIEGQYIPSDLSNLCKILSFTGGIGRVGIMKKDCPWSIMTPPTDLTLSPGIQLPGITELPPDVQLPVIKIQGAQLDIMSLEYVHRVYKFISESPFTDDMDIKSQLSFRVVVKEIPNIYTNCQVTAFPKSKIPDIPFNIIPALQDKHYQLHPNEHEDCVFRGNCSRLGCEVLEKSKQVCPYYGVYVVYSTIPEDINATLCGEEDNHIYYNLNTRAGYTANQYWLTKIEEHMDEKIRNAETKNPVFYIKERDRIIKLYEKMTRLFQDDLPIADEVAMDTPLPEINLSEILEIFKYGMGYDEINIIDPSCDSCVYAKKPLKVLANKQWRISRLNRQNTKVGPSIRTTLGGRKPRRKHKTRKSRKIRKHKTYKKRKHIKMSYK
jgi:hypothetical protein